MGLQKGPRAAALRDQLWQAYGATGLLAGSGFRSAGFHADLVPGRDAVALAQQLHERYGTDIDLSVGGVPYPDAGSSPQRPARRRQARTKETASQPLAGLKLLAVPALASFGPGDDITGHVQLHNAGTSSIAILTGPAGIAGLLDRDGNAAGGFNGFLTDNGVGYRLAPGDTAEMPFVGGTYNGTWYGTPPGDYDLVVSISYHRLTGDGGLLPGEEVLTTPPVPVRITA